MKLLKLTAVCLGLGLVACQMGTSDKQEPKVNLVLDGETKTVTIELPKTPKKSGATFPDDFFKGTAERQKAEWKRRKEATTK